MGFISDVLKITKRGTTGNTKRDSIVSDSSYNNAVKKKKQNRDQIVDRKGRTKEQAEWEKYAEEQRRKDDELRAQREQEHNAMLEDLRRQQEEQQEYFRQQQAKNDQYVKDQQAIHDQYQQRAAAKKELGKWSNATQTAEAINEKLTPRREYNQQQKYMAEQRKKDDELRQQRSLERDAAEAAQQWNRYMAQTGKDEKALTRAESRYRSAVESAEKLSREQKDKQMDTGASREMLDSYMEKLSQAGKRKNTNNVFLGDMDYSKWMGEKSEGVKAALEIGNAQRATQQWWADRESGKLGANGDIAGMNQAQRDAYRAELEDEKKNISADVQERGQTGGVNFNGILDLYDNEEIRKLQEILQGNYSEREKQDAEDRLQMLRSGERDQYGRTATERANEAVWRLENDYDPEDTTEQTQDARRRMVWDLMNGEGAYDGLTAEEKEQANMLIDRATGRITNGPDEYTAIDNELSDLRTIESQLEALDYQDLLEKKYNNLMDGEITGDTEWHEENSVTDQYTDEAWDTMKLGNNVDDVYNLLRPGAYPEKWDITDTGVGAALLMDDRMRDKFISLYNANKKDEAWAFFEGVLPYLNQAYHYFEKTKQEEEASRNPFISTLGTEAAHILQPAEFLANLPGQVKALLTGEESGVTDPYSSNYALARYKQNVRSRITQNLGDWGWLYSGVMSGVDSALNVALAKGIGLTGNALQYGTLALFGTQAFDTSLQSAMASGTGNFAYDVMEAFIDSAIETATEIWSVENWLADPTNILTYVAKIGISEPSEEIVGAIAKPYIKELLGHKNQYKSRADQIWAAGYYVDDNGNKVKVKDHAEATRQAMREWNHDIRMAAQEALLSVGPAMVYGSAQIAQNNQNVGRQIQQQQYENGTTGLDTVLESAKGMDTTTRSFQEAQKIGERLEQNRKVSPGKVGQLASDMMRESQEQAEQKAEDALRNEVRKELAGKEIRGSNAEEMTDLIVKALDAGGIENLTKKEREKIHDSSVGYNTLMKFSFASEQSSRAVAAQTEATQAERKAMQSVSDALTQKKTQTEPDDFVGKQLATQDDIDRAEGKRTKQPDEVIVDRKFARLDGMELVDSGDGKQEWKYKVHTENGTEYKSAGEIKATGLGTAAVIRQRDLNPTVYSGDYTNELLKQVSKQTNNQNIGRFMMEAEKVRWAAFLGQSMPKTSAMSEEQAKDFYRISQNDLRTEWQQDQATRTENFRGRGQGQAYFDGAEFGTEEWTKKLDEMDLSREERQLVDGLAAFAQDSGIRFDFVDQINGNDFVHGSENQGGIRIALQSYDSEAAKKAGQKHHIAVTVGHELTHWMRRNNASGYIEMQDFVLRSMSERGINVAARAMQMMESRAKAGDSLTMTGAIEEIVANACDQTLGSEEGVRHLEETSPKLAEKIRNFVKDLVQRIKAAIGTGEMLNSASKDALRMVGEEANRLHKLWWGKFDETLNRRVQELQAPAEGQPEKAAASVAENVRLSQAEFTNGIQKGMSDEQRYDVLKNTKVTIANSAGKITNNELTYYGELKKYDSTDEFRKLAIKN